MPSDGSGVVLPPPQALDFRCDGYGDFILSVNRLDRAKRIDLLLDAARSSGFPVVVAGDGPDRERLEALEHELGIARQCFFVGYQPDVAGYYGLFDAFLLPSVNEGTPVSAIEALAARTPVVATRVGGVPDVVRDGLDGYLVSAGDVEGAASKLELLAAAGDHDFLEALTHWRDEQAPGWQNSKKVLSFIDNVKINHLFTNAFFANRIQRLLHCKFLAQLRKIFARIRQNRLL